MTAYADSSFIVSFYVLDGNSATASNRLRADGRSILISDLVELEVTNALALLVFREYLKLVQAGAALSLFQRDVEAGVFHIRPVTATAFRQAKQLALSETPSLGTRALDTLHVASALAFGSDTFYTFDHRQAKLALTAGLRVP